MCGRTRRSEQAPSPDRQLGRAQEYFAPLRSRHISLQQWERGLLFESWGSPGRADRRKSGEPSKHMGAPEPEEQEFRPVKKVIARSVSFSASIGREVGTEVKTKNFARGLSFPSLSLASSGEIIPEESDYCTARRSNADLSPMFPAQTSTAYLFPRSLERVDSGHVESEISDSSCQDSSDSSDISDRPADLDPRPWSRKFFSGGLSFSRDKSFFSGVLSFSKDKKCFSGSLSLPRPCGRSAERSQSWGVDEISGVNYKNDNASSSSESRFKNRFLARVLTFSRSLDPRGEVSSDYTSKSDRRTEIRRGLSFSRSLDPRGEVSSEYTGKSDRRTEIRRGLSFSRSLDPRGEVSSDYGIKSDRRTEIRRGLSFSRSLDPRGEISSDYNIKSDRRTTIRRGLSFSRSLDVNGEFLSSEDNGSSRSFNSGRLPEFSWSRKFISRSGVFFSRSSSPKRPRDSPSHLSDNEKYTAKAATEVRPRKLFGRGFSLSFSRFLDPNGESSSVNSGGTNGPGNPDKESHLRRFFTRVFPSSKSVNPADQPSGGAAGNPTGSSGNNTKSLSSRFFSKDWSWSRSKSRSSSPAKNSSQSLASSRKSSANSDDTDSNTVTSSRHSQALKTWWSKRFQSGVSSRSALSPENSRLVLLEKVPAVDDPESDDLTVYVGERGGSLTKYVLAKKILRHHLFQVLLKCSQDELGSDHDYSSGVPIICDPALFLQVARVVGGNFASETQLCR